jgi:hypothetical protein
VKRRRALKEDAPVRLYKRKETVSKNGKKVRKQALVDTPYRIIRFRPPESSEGIFPITGVLHVRAERIALRYQQRWDIFELH